MQTPSEELRRLLHLLNDDGQQRFLHHWGLAHAGDYVSAMTCRRVCLLLGQERLASRLMTLAEEIQPADDEHLAAGYGI